MLASLWTQLVEAVPPATLPMLSSTSLQTNTLPDSVVFLPGPFDGRLVICGFPGQTAQPGLYGVRSLRPTNPKELLTKLKSRFEWIPTTSSDSAQGQDEAQTHDNTVSLADRFLVWNLSGVDYDASLLGGNVIEYDSPGRPVPPLNILAEIAMAIHAWLTIGLHHVAIVHDLSGRRAALVAACAIELARPPNVESALHSIVVPALGSVGRALVPSQLRYFDYFCSLRATLPDHTSSGEPLRLDIPQRKLELSRVIINGVPAYERTIGREGNARIQLGCAPLLEVYNRDGKLIGTSSVSTSRDDLETNFVHVEEGSFTLVPLGEVALDGDVLLLVVSCVKFTRRMKVRI